MNGFGIVEKKSNPHDVSFKIICAFVKHIRILIGGS